MKGTTEAAHAMHPAPRFSTGTQIMANPGILITQLLGLFWSTGRLWRVILATGGVIALVKAWILPLAGQESPKYLADNGKPTGHIVAPEATRTRCGYRCRSHGMRPQPTESRSRARGPAGFRRHATPSRPATHLGKHDESGAGSASISDAVQAAKKPTIDPLAKKPTLGPLAALRHPDTAPAVFAVTMIMLAQQLTGINSIFMYGVGLLSVQLGAHSTLLIAGVSNLNFLITATAAPRPDCLGRKPCLLLSISGMGASSLALALAIPRSLSALSGVAALAFVVSLTLGLGSIPSMLVSELVAPDCHGTNPRPQRDPTT